MNLPQGYHVVDLKQKGFLTPGQTGNSGIVIMDAYSDTAIVAHLWNPCC
jgi:hypothetical protein